MNILDLLYYIRNQEDVYWDIGKRVKYEDAINRIMPCYFRAFPCKALQKQSRKQKVIVSLTTIPSRIDKVWIPIECMMRQSHKPDEIILWLGEEFKNMELPQTLRELQAKGLNIRWCKDVGVHTKYYYVLKEYKDAYVITIDDDMYYGTGLIKDLLRTAHKYPGCVCARWVWQLRYSLHNRMYESTRFNSFVLRNDKVMPSHELLALGVGGVLYPPGLLEKELFELDKARELARNADDIWLKAVEIINGVKVAKVEEKFAPDVIVSETQEVALSHQNVGQNNNQKYLQIVFDHYNLWELI
ncbi:MAG: hypothetical protein NC416_00185 [Eubacterium sp.]|nr:hypothetical protein [Eubacterium sp.]